MSICRDTAVTLLHAPVFIYKVGMFLPITITCRRSLESWEVLYVLGSVKQEKNILLSQYLAGSNPEQANDAGETYRSSKSSSSIPARLSREASSVTTD
jgi:hypothetical protein